MRLNLVLAYESNGKNYAEVVSVPYSDNLKRIAAEYNAAKVVMPCASKREAQRIAEVWNKEWKEANSIMDIDDFHEFKKHIARDYFMRSYGE